ncbi:MAG: aminopeptidase P family protein [candidate division Zixibacteria bacterium]|nr:aminopeptidase P family protein [candidate division Zixibacteria bacterium]
MKNRIKKLQGILLKENLDFLLITFLPHVRYLSGYSGTNGMILASPKSSIFLTDFRYKEQVKEQVKNMRVMIADRDLFSSLSNLPQLKAKRIKLGFEADHLNCKTYQGLKALLPDCILVPTEKVVETLIIKKDKSEIEKIRKAIKITDRAFSEILDLIKPGVRELDISAEIEYRMKRYGSSTPYYETIVASGKRSALPHGVASSKRIGNNEFVTMDFGAVFDGYTADLTRTVVVGKANGKQKQVYNTVLKAQGRAISKARSKMKACDLDKIARDVIKKAGYGKYFGHGLGHGIGVLIHDNPAINPTNKLLLEPGMVITIEPGIYIPNWGGVRIEDDVLITQRGCEVLTTSERNLIEL